MQVKVVERGQQIHIQTQGEQVSQRPPPRKEVHNSKFHFQKIASKIMKFKKRYDHLRKKMMIFSCFDVNPAADSKSVIFN